MARALLSAAIRCVVPTGQGRRFRKRDDVGTMIVPGGVLVSIHPPG